MYSESIIKFGSGLAKDLGLTRERFQAMIVWNALPKYIFFAQLIPNTYDDVQYLLDRLDAMNLNGVFQSPHKMVEFMLNKNCYRHRPMRAGGIVWHR